MRILFVSLAVVLGDQITKLLVKGFSIPFLGISAPGMRIGTSIPILGDFVRLTYIENPGMAFGIELGSRLFFSLFSIAASIAIVLYLYQVRKERLLLRFPLALILGGAVGNLIDRVFYGVFFQQASLFHGSVVDFVDVDFFNINVLGYHLNRWPIFNVADASVTIGVLTLLIFHRSLMRSDGEEPLPQPESQDSPTAPPPTV